MTYWIIKKKLIPVFISRILILGTAILGLLVFQFVVILVFYYAYFYSQ